MKKRIMIGDTPVWIRSFRKAKYHDCTGWTRLCPLCRSKTELGEAIYFIRNNYKLFPSTLVHEDCVKAAFPVSSIDWPLIIKRLQHDWDEAEKNRKHNHCWYII